MPVKDRFDRLRRDSPLRPTDWRWQRACYLKKTSRKPTRKHDDKWIAEALRFKYDLDRCKTDQEYEDLQDNWPHFYLAYEIYDEDDDTAKTRHHPTRYEIEARILAEESFEAIAWKVYAPEGVIEIYEKVFFNVLDRIQSESYIHNQVIGNDVVQRGLSDKDYDKVWKLYGYRRGPGAVDELVTTFPDARRKLGKGEMLNKWEEDKRQTMNRKAALAARSMSINNFTNLPIVEQQTNIIDVDKKAAGEGGSTFSNEQWLQIISAMLSSLPWSIGREISPEDALVKQGYNKTTHKEPRAGQILMLGHGEGRVPEIVDKKFPPPIYVDGQEMTNNGEAK